MSNDAYDETDEPEDRPRRRASRRRDDDDEYVERSAPSRSSPLLILGIVGGVCFVMMLVCAGLIALLLPAVSKVREARERTQVQRDMKSIGLGFFNQDSATNGFAAPFAVNPTTGEVYKNFSWRTGLLPYIEQDALYRNLDLMQPWDSPRNSPLTNSVVKDYQDVSDPNKTNVGTHYQVFVGGGAIFNADGKPVSLISVTDGTSNTILFTQAFATVPWAKPQDLPYSPTAPLPKLGTPYLSNGFHVGMADGSVRFINKSVSDKTMRHAIEKADGNILGGDF